MASNDLPVYKAMPASRGSAGVYLLTLDETSIKLDISSRRIFWCFLKYWLKGRVYSEPNWFPSSYDAYNSLASQIGELKEVVIADCINVGEYKNGLPKLQRKGYIGLFEAEDFTLSGGLSFRLSRRIANIK